MSNFESMAKRTFAGPPMPEDIEAPLNAVDGRTLRKTGRTVQLATARPSFRSSRFKAARRIESRCKGLRKTYNW